MGTENDENKITVIVTVHNSEKYIRECLESVLVQTFSQFEVLCIDGGSTDGSPEILKEYAKRDGRIKIINDPNTSYGHKVNRGIREAGGEYISVLESDDMYEPFMLEKLYEVAKRYEVDFVNANYTCFFDCNGQRFGYGTKMYHEEDYGTIINYRKSPERFGMIPRFWTGLFRKEYLVQENIKMNESAGASYQDMSFRFLTSILAERAYHLDISVYLYRIDNPGSSMHDSKKTIVIAEEHNFLKEELRKRNITDEYILFNELQWKYTDFRGNMKHLRGRYRQELFDRYLEEREKDKCLLERLGKFGYSSQVSEMIKEPPETVAALIEADATAEEARMGRLYEFLNQLTKLDKSQKIVVFGCGYIGKYILDLLIFERGRVCCLADNSELLWGTVLRNHKVLSPEEAVKRYPSAIYIIANKYHAREMRQQLRLMGICDSVICVY